MTQFSKDEPFLIGLDFDGTITTEPLGGSNYPPVQKGFEEFYQYFHNYNSNNDDKVFMVIHTARNLDNDDNWKYIKDYLARYSINEIYLPKRNGHSMKNNLNRKIEFPIKFSTNSKIPCSCYIDDINIGTPKLENGELDWKKIKEEVLKIINSLKEKYSVDKKEN